MQHIRNRSLLPSLSLSPWCRFDGSDWPVHSTEIIVLHGSAFLDPTRHDPISNRRNPTGPHSKAVLQLSWWRSIVVRPPVLPACFPYLALDWQLAV